MAKDARIPFVAAGLDFLLSPTIIPAPEHGLERFNDECDLRLNELICEAWKNGVLPKDTALVQCLTKRPTVKKADFRHPVIFQSGLPDRDKLLACFAHTTHFLREPTNFRYGSSHARVRELGDLSRGTIIVFTRNAPLGPTPIDFTHVLQFGFPNGAIGKKLDVSSCSKIIRNSLWVQPVAGERHVDGFEAFDVNAFLDDPDVQRLPAITEPKPAGAAWTGIPSPARNCSAGKKVTEDLFPNICDDTGYQNRVAALLEYGSIILAAPQSFELDTKAGAKPASLDSGLTVVLRTSKSPTHEELLNVYAVAQKLSSFIASTHGLLDSLVRQKTSEIMALVAGGIAHEFGNTAENVRATLEDQIGKPVTEAVVKDAEARLKVAKTTLEAITGLTRSEPDEPFLGVFKDIVKNFDNYHDYKVTCHVSPEVIARNPSLRSAFRLIFTEMLRNALKRNPRALKSAAKCRAHAAATLLDNSLTVTVTNPTDIVENAGEPAIKKDGLRIIKQLCIEFRGTITPLSIDNDVASISVTIPLSARNNSSILVRQKPAGKTSS